MFFLGASPQTPGLKGATQNCADYNQEDSKGVKNKMLFHNICKLYLESHETVIRNVKHSSRYTGKVGKRGRHRKKAAQLVDRTMGIPHNPETRRVAAVHAPGVSRMTWSP